MPAVHLTLAQKDGHAIWLAWSVDPVVPLSVRAKFSAMATDTDWQPMETGAVNVLLRAGLAIYDPQLQQCFTLLLAHDGFYRINFPDRTSSNPLRVIQKLETDGGRWLGARRADLTQAEQFIFVRTSQWALAPAVQQAAVHRFDALHWLELCQQDPTAAFNTLHYEAPLEHRLNAAQVAPLKAILELPLVNLKKGACTAKEYGVALRAIMQDGVDPPVAIVPEEVSAGTRENIDDLLDYVSLEHINSYHKGFYALTDATGQGRDVTAADVHRFVMEVLRAEYVIYQPQAASLILTTKAEAEWQFKLETEEVTDAQITLLVHRTTLLLAIINASLQDQCRFLYTLFLNWYADFDLLSRIVSQLAQGTIEAEYSDLISHFTLVLEVQGVPPIARHIWQERARVFYGIQCLHTFASLSATEMASFKLNVDLIDAETCLAVLPLMASGLRFPWVKWLVTSFELDFIQLSICLKKLTADQTKEILWLLNENQKLANLNADKNAWFDLILSLKKTAQASLIRVLQDLTPSIELTVVDLAHYVAEFTNDSPSRVLSHMTILLDTIVLDPKGLHDFLTSFHGEDRILFSSAFFGTQGELLRKIIGSASDFMAFLMLSDTHTKLLSIDKMDDLLPLPLTSNDIVDYIAHCESDQRLPALQALQCLVNKVINSPEALSHFIRCFADDQQAVISEALADLLATHIPSLTCLWSFLDSFTQTQQMQLAPVMTPLFVTLKREPHDLLFFLTLLADAVKPAYLSAWQPYLADMIITGVDLLTLLYMSSRSNRLSLLFSVEHRLAALIDSASEPACLIKRIYATLKMSFRLLPVKVSLAGLGNFMRAEQNIIHDLQSYRLNVTNTLLPDLTTAQSGLIHAFIEARRMLPGQCYAQPCDMARDLLVLVMGLLSHGLTLKETDPFTMCFMRSMATLEACPNGFGLARVSPNHDSTPASTLAIPATTLSNGSSGYGPAAIVVYQQPPGIGSS